MNDVPQFPRILKWEVTQRPRSGKLAKIIKDRGIEDLGDLYSTPGALDNIHNLSAGVRDDQPADGEDIHAHRHSRSTITSNADRIRRIKFRVNNQSIRPSKTDNISLEHRPSTSSPRSIDDNIHGNLSGYANDVHGDADHIPGLSSGYTKPQSFLRGSTMVVY
ncbi:hypothetical protein LWI29_034772 [Acer saccharum]|uniref:Uncharacterized protein n=1 Tax=Acer saccharum TaxID=4024 RepID=A0AA39SWE4_ACESA|nr:hypothetical protein LWI29_034772 [Acer saccharum]